MSKNPTSAKFIKMYSIEYEKEMDSFVIEYDSNAYLTWRFGAFEYPIYMDDDYQSGLRNADVINTDGHDVSDIGKKCNMMWIEDIKKHYNWKVGDVIYLNSKQRVDGCFYIMRGWRDDDDAPRVEDKRCYCLAIDSDGYVVKRCFQYYHHKTSSLMPHRDYIFRILCEYNDYITKNGVREYGKEDEL